MSSIRLDNGNEINVICTRFAEHLTQGKRDPLKHFDEARKRSWYDATSPALTPPAQPR
jgi:hypothetical protein